MRPTMMIYIREESACLARILRGYRQKPMVIETLARQHPVHRTLLLAIGPSLNATLCARYFFKQRFGMLVDIKESYNFTHYEAIDPYTDLAATISQSGKSASALGVMRKVQILRLLIFALTPGPQNPMAHACGDILDINTGIESVGFVTRDFSAVMLDLLLITLIIAHQRGKVSEVEEQRYLTGFQQLLVAILDVITRTSRFIGRYSETLRSEERFVATGCGALVDMAKEFETRSTETVRVPSSGFELEAYMRGPYLETSARHVMLFIEDAPNARTRALRDYMAPSIARALTPTLNDAEDAQTLTLSCPYEHHLASLLLIVPVQMLARYTAGLKDVDLAKRIFDDFDRVLKSKI